jgi:hypothetical protein
MQENLFLLPTLGGYEKRQVSCNAAGEDTLEACMERLQGVDAMPDGPHVDQGVISVDLKEVSTEDLVLELKRRNEDFKFILPSMNIDDVVQRYRL